MTYRYLRSCVDWPDDDVRAEGGLSDLIDEMELIGRRAFLARVDRGELARLEQQLGYEAHPRRGLTMAGDWHVAYFRSRLHGRRVYGFQWSGIEHVFTEAPSK